MSACFLLVSSSSRRCSHNRYFDDSTIVARQQICAFSLHRQLGLVKKTKWIWGVSDDRIACCVRESESGTDESVRVFILKTSVNSEEQKKSLILPRPGVEPILYVA